MLLSHHTTLLPHVTPQLHTAVGILPCSPHRTVVRHLAFLVRLRRSNTGLATLDHLHYMQNLKPICRYKTSRLVLTFTPLIFDVSLRRGSPAASCRRHRSAADHRTPSYYGRRHRSAGHNHAPSYRGRRRQAPIITSSCRTRRPPLDMDDALVTPIATSSLHNGFAPSKPPAASHRHRPPSGIAPQPAVGGITPPTAFFSRRRPPSRMESAAPQPTPSQRGSPWTILSWMTSSRRPTTTPSSSCGIPPQPAARGIAPSPASSRHRPHLTWSRPRRRRRLGSTWLCIPIVGAAFRRSAVSSSTSSCLAQLSISSLEFLSTLKKTQWRRTHRYRKHTRHTQTHTHFTKERKGFASSPGENTCATWFFL